MDRQQEEIQKSFEALEAKSVKSTRASAAGAVTGYCTYLKLTVILNFHWVFDDGRWCFTFLRNKIGLRNQVGQGEGVWTNCGWNWRHLRNGKADGNFQTQGERDQQDRIRMGLM